MTKRKKDAAKKSRAHPWRDNLEAVTISIVTIVLFKYFVLEAYKIPTGSMQPTLLGNPETGLYDRVLVDKFSYHYRDPERFEIVVFRYPLDRSKNFIKRIVGMPSETLEILDGDLWVQGPDDAAPHVLRRPRPVQDAQLRRLDTTDEWRVDGDGWSGDPSRFAARGSGTATFPRTTSSVRDGYTDGYPAGMRDRVITKGKRSNHNEVSDLRVCTTVECGEGCAALRVDLREGDRAFRFVLPGPAAPEGDRARIEADLADEEGGPRVALAEGPLRLEAGDAVTFEVQNLDDLLELRVDGDLVAALEVPPAEDRRGGVTLAVEAAPGREADAEFRDVRVWRDLFYTTAGQKRTRWTIPEGSYVMLGDNSQDSSDGRDWTLTGFEVVEGEDAGLVVRGNDRGQVNPRYVPRADGPTQIFFDDELGERHLFLQREVERLEDVSASLVPRELIRGRAVLVVWPLSPTNDVYRLKWVR